MSLHLVIGTLASKGRLVAEWMRCSFLPQFSKVSSAHRAIETGCLGELHKELGYDASAGVRDVALKRGVLDPDQFLYGLPTVFIYIGQGVSCHLPSRREEHRRAAALQ